MIQHDSSLNQIQHSAIVLTGYSALTDHYAYPLDLPRERLVA